MNDFLKLEKEIRESEGFIAKQRLIYFGNIFHIHHRNYYRLSQLLQAFSNPEKMLPIWDIERRDDLDFAIMELLTYLHNYLAGFKTLVDHTRVMMRHTYSDDSFIKEYQSRVDSEFKNDPLSCFIQNLRNYLLHYSLPSTFSEFNISKDPETGEEIVKTRATIKKASLLFWSGWSSEAKTYLDNFDEDIQLLTVISDHEEKVRNFYE